MESSGQIPIRIKIFSVLLVLMPILNQYAITTLFLMDIVALIGIVLFFLRGRHCIKANYAMIIYVLYILLDTVLYSNVLSGVPVSTIVIRVFRVVVLYGFFFFISDDYFDIGYAFRVYTKVVYISTVIIAFQILMYFITGNDINFLIPGLPINYGSFATSSELMHSWHVNATIGYYRPCSFFLEPAMQAQYVLPWLAISLATKQDELGKRPMLKLILVTLGICCTTSSLGILCAAILWLINSCISISKKNTGKTILAVPILLVGLLIITNTGILDVDIFNKLSRINSSEGGSTTWRLLRGFACFKEMPFLNQLIGCGYGNISTFFTQNNITTIYDAGLTVNSYMNAGSTLLCSLGLAGFILYLIAMRKILFSNMKPMKFSILICLLILVFTSSIFDSAVYFMVVLFMQQLDYAEIKEHY